MTACLVALRGPVLLAKTLAALDVLSGGRLVEDELALEDVDGPGRLTRAIRPRTSERRMGPPRRAVAPADPVSSPL